MLKRTISACPISTSNNFGGDWTEEKLDIVVSYLSAYTTALSKQDHWEKVYIDPFAGCGQITLKDSREIFGSAIRALDLKNPFDRYFFIELEEKKAVCLEEEIRNRFPDRRCEVITGDANEKLQEIIREKIDSYRNRGVVFLDPFSMDVKWETIKAIASSKCLDFWYLFPVSAVNRQLARDGVIPDYLRRRLDDALGGRDWYEHFYRQRPLRQMSLLDDGFVDSEFEKQTNVEGVLDYTINNLRTVFPYVCQSYYTLRSTKNAVLFYLIFAVSNPSPKAFGLAHKLADSILNRKGKADETR